MATHCQHGDTASMEEPSPHLDSLDPAAASPEDWAVVEASLAAWQETAQYHQAQGSLRDLVARLGRFRSGREAALLAGEVERLSALANKLEQGAIHIAVFGLVGRGKSSLLNALLGEAVFATGPTHGVTQRVEQVPWEEAGPEAWRVRVQGAGRSPIELIDTPGLDEVQGAERAELAQAVARQADLILFVVAGDISRVEYEALLALRQLSKPMLLVLNKVDQYPERDRQAIYETLRDQRLKDLISPDEIVMAAADPLVVTAVRGPDGQLRTQRQRGEPQVAELKLKILEILQREGLALVALNTLLYANDVNEAIVAKKLQLRQRAAADVIWSGVMTKAITTALNPITGIDLLTGLGVDLALIVALSHLYGLPMTQAGALQILKTIVLGAGGLALGEGAIALGLSSLKGVLGLVSPATAGLSLSAYVPVAMTQAAIAGISTYTLGQVTRTYLANGATWGPEGPKTVILDILANLDEASILHRIRRELQAKLNNSGDP